MKKIQLLSIFLILFISFTFLGEQPLSVNAQSAPFIRVTVNAGAFKDKIVLEGFPATDEYAEVIVFRDSEGGEVIWSDENVILESGNTSFKLPFGLEIKAGNHIVVVGQSSGITAAYTIQELEITALDAETGTISGNTEIKGSGQEGQEINLHIYKKDGDFLFEVITVADPMNGIWTAEFNPGDINAGMDVTAFMYDERGNSTKINLVGPTVVVNRLEGALACYDFTPNSWVRLEIFDELGDPVMNPVDLATDEIGESHWIGSPIDLGYLVRVTDLGISRYKETVVRLITLEYIDEHFEYSGYCPDCGEVEIRAFDSKSSIQYSQFGSVDGNGKYKFILGDIEHIPGKTYRHSARVYDVDGDVSEAYLFPDYLLKITYNTVKLRRFEPGRIVKLSILDEGGAVLYPPDEFTLNEFTIPESGSLIIRESEHGVEILPGYKILVTDTDGNPIDSLVRADIEILQADLAADTLSGTAPPFSYVTAIVDNDEDFYEVRVQADDKGRWVANFSTVDSVEVEDMCYRRGLISDADGDKTESYLEMEEGLGAVCNPIKVVFVPSADTNFMIESSDLIEQGLKDETGLYFEVSVPDSYADTIEEICASPGDTIGFLPAFGYVLAHDLCGVEPGLASERGGWTVYWGQFLVPRSSELLAFGDLEGKTWGIPDGISTSGFLYPLILLENMGITVGEKVEAGDHAAAVWAVYNGEVDFATTYFGPPTLPEGAGPWQPGMLPDIPDELVQQCDVNGDGHLYCGGYRVWDARASIAMEAPDVIEKVRILDITQEIPNDTLSFGPGFPAELKQTILDGVLSFLRTDLCAQSLCHQDFYAWTGAGTINDENFDSVRLTAAILGITLENIDEYITGSNADLDGDGVLNGEDAFPLDADEWLDSDADGTGDKADLDDDNDGILDVDDNAPLKFNPDQQDTDNDGIGDVADPCPTTLDNQLCISYGGSVGESIGPSGGTLSLMEPSMMVPVPAGALDNETSIFATYVSRFPIPGLWGRMMNLFYAVLGPPGTSFNVPVTISFGWKDENDDGLEDTRLIQENYLAILHNNQFLGWCYQNPGCDRDANIWTFEVMNFSEFVLGFPINEPPAADAGGSYTINEGEMLILDASGSSDLDNDIVSYKWDLDNDGEFDDADGITVEIPVSDDDTFSANLKVSDVFEEFHTDTTQVTVNNVAPQVGEITAPSAPVQVGTMIETSATFSDAGILDTFTASWDWGDGNETAGIIDGFVVSSSHVYDTPGVYTIELVVSDDDGGSNSSKFEYVVVYNPEGGFVTGGGWIFSPEGACQLEWCEDDTTGKASFGFVSKYKKGANIPTGETQFQFKAGDLNFHSDSYEWLVVAGAKAMYKGVGTINGEGEYKFMLSAVDADINDNDRFETDRFRIKIWEESRDGVEDVAYDNGLGGDDQDNNATTEIEGGNIVVHTSKKY